MGMVGRRAKQAKFKCTESSSSTATSEPIRTVIIETNLPYTLREVGRRGECDWQ